MLFNQLAVGLDLLSILLGPLLGGLVERRPVLLELLGNLRLKRVVCTFGARPQ